MRYLVPALILLIAATVPHGAAAQRAVPADREQVMLSFAPLVRQASPAVVNVFTRKAVRRRGPSSPLFNDPFFRRFFGDSLGLPRPRERVENSLGSGVIVRPDGLIVTNFHVIEGADSITVVLSDRREFEARILREDERTDLAILKIDAGVEELPHIALGDSEGMVKTVFDAKTGELLGAHMIGAEVTELIQGYTVGKTLETTEAELMETVFPHPTLSEMMHESVLDAYGRAVHF